MTDPTDQQDDDLEVTGPPPGHQATATEKARAAGGFSVLGQDPAAFVEVLPGPEVEGGDPLAGLRRATGGTVTDRARRAGSSDAGDVELVDVDVDDPGPGE